MNVMERLASCGVIANPSEEIRRMVAFSAKRIGKEVLI